MTDEELGYSKEYYDAYHSGGDSVNYLESPEIMETQTNLASDIIKLLHPGKTLDVGCACGHLVSALRNAGVDAYGTDASAYAIEHVRPEHRDFFCRGALPDLVLPDSFPKKYDLVTCIEVIEHIREDCNQATISALTRLGDTILFSSTPDDFDEPTHINVHPISFWCAEFAKVGFYPDMTADLSFGAPQFVLFRKKPCCPGMEELFRPLDLLYQARTDLTKLAVERLQLYQEASGLAQERLRLYCEAREKLDKIKRILNVFGILYLYRGAKSIKHFMKRFFGKENDIQVSEGNDKKTP